MYPRLMPLSQEGRLQLMNSSVELRAVTLTGAGGVGAVGGDGGGEEGRLNVPEDMYHTRSAHWILLS